jgi:predicted nucleic acid-binding protein
MQNKAHDISTYAFGAAERVLPDANIWLYLYAPAGIAYPSISTAIAAYSKSWKTMFSAGVEVCLDAIILSEVVNVVLRNEWQRVDPPHRTTRARKYRTHFRQSAEYPPAASSVEKLARLIVSDGKALDHTFSKWDLARLLTEFGGGSTDWNDQLLVESCRHNGMKLLTHDADHVYGGIEVLTANPKLIAACP